MRITKEELEQYEILHEKIQTEARRIFLLMNQIPHNLYEYGADQLDGAEEGQISMYGFNEDSHTVYASIPFEYFTTPDATWLPALTKKTELKFQERLQFDEQVKLERDRREFERLKAQLGES